MPYSYVVKPLASLKIWSFYRNVARKYAHTFDEDDLIRNVKSTIHSMFLIESRLLRRTPSISRWTGKYMAYSGSWYYAYTIEGDTIVIHDACHRQNMHE